MAFWEDVDLTSAATIAARLVREDLETTPNQKKKWRLAEPRHTHLERNPFTERFGQLQKG